MSRTYRMRSDTPLPESDPDNRLLSRMNRKRLDAESLRDAMLATAAATDARWAGPNVGDARAVNSNDTSAQNLEYGYAFGDTRRSVYTAAFRNVRHPLFEAFDFADINQPIGQRTTSTVATQALYLMNHPQVIELARTAARRLPQDGAPEAGIRRAYQLALSRPPDAAETALARDFLEVAISGNATEAERRDAWAQLIQTLWATPEFRYLD